MDWRRSSQQLNTTMNKKIIIIILLSIIAIGGGVAYYIWNKPKSNAADVKPTYVLTADDLAAAFIADEIAANGKYVKDTVAFEMTGIVDSAYTNDGGEDVLVFRTNTEAKVACYFNVGQDSGNPLQFKKGETAKLKGFCGGIDMFLEVQMRACAIVK
jgi:hypothetical protein